MQPETGPLAELQRRHSELELLIETVQDLTSTLSTHDVIARLVDRTLVHLDSELASVLTVEPDQAATGFEAVSYRDGIGDRGDRWSITASKDFFDSVTQSATMIIQIVCPEGGIWVHQGAVRDGYNPRSGASPQECSGAVTLTEFVGYQSNQVGFTVYLPDGVEGYFPYTVVASAA